MPICCPNCGRILARRYADHILIAYHGQRYEVGQLRQITCRCKTAVSLPLSTA